MYIEKSNTNNTTVGLGYIPMVVEQSGRGERAYDIYSRLLKEGRALDVAWWRTRTKEARAKG